MNDEARPRVFLVEDEELNRVGARALLEPAYEIVGESDNVTDSVEMIREREPDLVLLDVRIREGNGAQVLEEVRKTNPDIKFLALTVATNKEDVLRMLRAGVDGYETKFDAMSDLPNRVRQTLDGGRPISRRVAAFMQDLDEAIPEASGIERLTPREREVLALIARGYTYAESAKQLGMAVKTVETHISHIFGKLGAATRHEATVIAYRHGFVEP
jgi:DNA-binding NarL/FixJ family response regulator